MKTIVKSILFCFVLIFLPYSALVNAKAPAVTANKPALPASARELRDSMVGNWLGEAPLKKGGTRKWLMQRNADGTYLVTFKLMPTDKPQKIWQEVGYWGVSHPIYFSIMKGWVTENGIEPSDPSDPYFYDAYKIISVDSKKFEYKSFSSENIFIIKKVSPDFSPNDL